MCSAPLHPQDHHLQLPPTILSTHVAKGLSLTMMERVVDLYRSKVTRMLTIQYRMNYLIMSWSSRTLYSDLLTAAPSVSNHLLSGLPNTVLLLMDTAGLRGRGSLAEGSS